LAISDQSLNRRRGQDVVAAHFVVSVSVRGMWYGRNVDVEY
jgi:hypothetical protein